MSIWSHIRYAVKALAQGESLASVFDNLCAPPERSVAFTIAVIALGAKMAKADGHVTRDEVRAFREVFQITAEDEATAARVFNMARQDAAGFEHYAARVARMFGTGDPILEDVVEGLFHIAVADGIYHPNEDAFLHEVADVLGLSERRFRALRARHVPSEAPDPHDVLGLEPDMPMEEMRRRYHRLVRDTHPDQMIARGVPEEAVQLATKRLAAINEAWEQILARNAGIKAVATRSG